MTALIQAHSLKKRFVMGTEEIWALNDLSLEVREADFIAITGASGSGKSTLLYVLGLLDQASSGNYLLEGRPANDLNQNQKAQLRNQLMGFVFQSFHLLPKSSALRNVAMPLVYAQSYGPRLSTREIEDKATVALTKVGLQHRLAHKPNELSGGQRQRVAIARAIVNQPKLIFADEPTGNLDTENGREIMNLFTALNQSGVTIIMVTHDPNIASYAKRIISMKDGCIEKDSYAVA